MMINQCGSFKGHTARKIVSDYVKKQNNAVLAEGRQYLVCNSDQVDKESYQSKLRKRAYAMVASGTYRKDLNLVEERDELQGDVFFSAEQQARERQG